MWQTPLRHDHLTGTSQASASSSRLRNAGSHGTVRLLRLNETAGPDPGCPAGRVGRSSDGADDAGSARVARTEDLPVDPVGGDAPSGERRTDLVHEGPGAAEVDGGVGRYCGVVEGAAGEVASHVEVLSDPVVRARFAVADEPMGVGEHAEEVVDLAGEAVLGPAAGAVDPPDLPR